MLSDALTNLEESQNNKLSVWKDASLIYQLALSIQNKCAKDIDELFALSSDKSK